MTVGTSLNVSLPPSERACLLGERRGDSFRPNGCGEMSPRRDQHPHAERPPDRSAEGRGPFPGRPRSNGDRTRAKYDDRPSNCLVCSANAERLFSQSYRGPRLFPLWVRVGGRSLSCSRTVARAERPMDAVAHVGHAACTSGLRGAVVQHGRTLGTAEKEEARAALLKEENAGLRSFSSGASAGDDFARHRHPRTTRWSYRSAPPLLPPDTSPNLRETRS